METLSSTTDIGRLVQTERKRQGYTQTKLARYADVGINFVSQLENGKDTAEIGKVLRVLQTLGIDLVAKVRSS